MATLNQPSSDEALGMSRFSVRRYSVQQALLMLAVNALLMAITATAATSADPSRIVLATAGMCLMLGMTALVMYAGIRTVKVELWIRRLGMGDYDYRIEPTGKDEISEACVALDTLRQSSIKALQLDTVRRLSDELQARNDDLEKALEELGRTQDVLVSRRKISELGSMAAGLAHELRNPLQFVKNFAEEATGLIEELEAALPDQEQREEIDEVFRYLKEGNEHILRNAERANRTVAQMEALSSASSGKLQTVGINVFADAQVQVACRAAAAQLPDLPTVSLGRELDPGAGEAPVMPQELNRVIANVILNSCQAMAERAELEDGYEPELTLGTRREGDTVVILVRDNGVGIAPEIMDRIFNPFFTTRPGNRSAGLGLSISHDIVQAHGGTLSAESEPGRFT